MFKSQNFTLLINNLSSCLLHVHMYVHLMQKPQCKHKKLMMARAIKVHSYSYLKPLLNGEIVDR